MTQERLAAARGWEAFYEHELRALAAEVRAHGATREALEHAAASPRALLARRAIHLLRERATAGDGEAPTAQLHARVRSDLERLVATTRTASA